MDHTTFDKAAYDRFRDNDRPGPIHMLNLVRLRQWAVYDDGHQCSGKEAYAIYGKEAAPVFAALGGSIVWRGQMEQMLIGPADEKWDMCFIAAYPTVQAFSDMHKVAAYRAAVVHRQAAVQDSRLIRMAPQDAGDNFGA